MRIQLLFFLSTLSFLVACPFLKDNDSVAIQDTGLVDRVEEDCEDMAEAIEALWDACEDEEEGTDCEDACGERARTAYEACLDDGGSESDCEARGEAAYEACMEACEDDGEDERDEDDEDDDEDDERCEESECDDLEALMERYRSECEDDDDDDDERDDDERDDDERDDDEDDDERE